jgi:hypothetical protein
MSMDNGKASNLKETNVFSLMNQVGQGGWWTKFTGLPLDLSIGSAAAARENSFQIFRLPSESQNHAKLQNAAYKIGRIPADGLCFSNLLFALFPKKYPIGMLEVTDGFPKSKAIGYEDVVMPSGEPEESDIENAFEIFPILATKILRESKWKNAFLKFATANGKVPRDGLGSEATVTRLADLDWPDWILGTLAFQQILRISIGWDLSFANGTWFNLLSKEPAIANLAYLPNGFRRELYWRVSEIKLPSEEKFQPVSLDNPKFAVEIDKSAEDALTSVEGKCFLSWPFLHEALENIFMSSDCIKDIIDPSLEVGCALAMTSTVVDASSASDGSWLVHVLWEDEKAGSAVSNWLSARDSQISTKIESSKEWASILEAAIFPVLVLMYYYCDSAPPFKTGHWSYLIVLEASSAPSLPVPEAPKRGPSLKKPKITAAPVHHRLPHEFIDEIPKKLSNLVRHFCYKPVEHQNELYLCFVLGTLWLDADLELRRSSEAWFAVSRNQGTGLFTPTSLVELKMVLDHVVRLVDQIGPIRVLRLHIACHANSAGVTINKALETVGMKQLLDILGNFIVLLHPINAMIYLACCDGFENLWQPLLEEQKCSNPVTVETAIINQLDSKIMKRSPKQALPVKTTLATTRRALLINEALDFRFWSKTENPRPHDVEIPIESVQVIREPTTLGHKRRLFN